MAEDNQNIYNYLDEELDADKLVSNLLHNSDAYIRHMGFTEPQAEQFRGSLQDYIDAIAEGRLSTTQQGVVTDSAGMLADNPRNYTLRRGRGRTVTQQRYEGLGRRRQDRAEAVFRPNNAVARYIENIAGAMSEKAAKEKKEPSEDEKFTWGKNGLWSSFMRDLQPNGAPDLNTWLDLDPYDEVTKSRGLTKRLARFSDYLGRYIDALPEEMDFSGVGTGWTRDDYVARLRALQDKLNTGQVDNELYMMLEGLGATSDLYRPYFTTKRRYGEEESAVDERAARLNKAVEDTMAAQRDRWYSQDNKFYRPTGGARKVALSPKASTPEEIRLSFETNVKNSGLKLDPVSLQQENGSHYAPYMEQLDEVYGDDLFGTVQGTGRYAGWRVMKGTYNPGNGSVLVYKPGSGECGRVFAGGLDTNFYNMYYSSLEQGLLQTLDRNGKPQFDEGGVLSYQKGGSADDDYEYDPEALALYQQLMRQYGGADAGSNAGAGAAGQYAANPYTTGPYAANPASANAPESMQGYGGTSSGPTFDEWSQSASGLGASIRAAGDVPFLSGKRSASEAWDNEGTGQGMGLRNVDKARLVAMAMDIAGMIDPDGISSAALFYGSDLTSLGADLSDPDVTKGQALTNFGLNAVLSTIGFLPVLGGMGKTGSLLKTASKLAKPMMYAGLAMGVFDTLSNGKEVLQSIGKLLGPKNGSEESKMTLNDWRNIYVLASTLIGGTHAIRHTRAKNVARRVGSKGDVLVAARNEGTNEEAMLRLTGADANAARRARSKGGEEGTNELQKILDKFNKPKGAAEGWSSGWTPLETVTRGRRALFGKEFRKAYDEVNWNDVVKDYMDPERMMRAAKNYHGLTRRVLKNPVGYSVYTGVYRGETPIVEAGTARPAASSGGAGGGTGGGGTPPAAGSGEIVRPARTYSDAEWAGLSDEAKAAHMREWYLKNRVSGMRVESEYSPLFGKLAKNRGVFESDAFKKGRKAFSDLRGSGVRTEAGYNAKVKADGHTAKVAKLKTDLGLKESELYSLGLLGSGGTIQQHSVYPRVGGFKDVEGRGCEPYEASRAEISNSLSNACYMDKIQECRELAEMLAEGGTVKKKILKGQNAIPGGLPDLSSITDGLEDLDLNDPKAYKFISDLASVLRTALEKGGYDMSKLDGADSGQITQQDFTPNYGGFKMNDDSYYANGEYGSGSPVSGMGIYNAIPQGAHHGIQDFDSSEYDWNDLQKNTNAARVKWQHDPTNRTNDFKNYARAWLEKNPGGSRDKLLNDYNRAVQDMYEYKHYAATNPGQDKEGNASAYFKGEWVRRFNDLNRQLYGSANSVGGVHGGYDENLANINGSTTAQRFIDITDDDIRNIDWGFGEGDSEELQNLLNGLSKNKYGFWYYDSPAAAAQNPAQTTPNDPNKTNTVAPPLSNADTEQEDLGQQPAGKPNTGADWGAIAQDIMPDLLRVGNLARTLGYNRWLEKQRPWLGLDQPHETHEQVIGDYGAMMRGNKQAAQIASKARRAAGADIDRNTAAMLDATISGNALRQQGNVTNDTALDKSVERARTTAAQNLAERARSASENYNRLNSYNQTLLANRMAARRARTESLNNFQQGFINRLEQKREEDRPYREQYENMALSKELAANLVGNNIIPDDENAAEIQKYFDGIFNGTMKSTDIPDDKRELVENAYARYREAYYQKQAARYGARYTPYYAYQMERNRVANADNVSDLFAAKVAQGGEIGTDTKTEIQRMRAKVSRMQSQQKHTEKRLDVVERDLDRLQRSSANYIAGTRKKV